MPDRVRILEEEEAPDLGSDEAILRLRDPAIRDLS
jgi:hypothetical protein